MRDVPLKAVVVGIVGILVYIPAVNGVFRWAIRNTSGGPWSGILSEVGVTGVAALGLVGGGLLLAVGWIFEETRGGGM